MPFVIRDQDDGEKVTTMWLETNAHGTIEWWAETDGVKEVMAAISSYGQFGRNALSHVHGFRLDDSGYLALPGA